MPRYRESSTPSANHDLETVDFLKSALPHARFCRTGTHVTSEWGEALEQRAALDFVAIGEYGYTIAELAEALEANSQCSDVPGLAGCRFNAD